VTKGVVPVNDGKARKAAASGDEAQRLRQREDAALEAAGFEPEGPELWAKGGVCYGREAALQNSRSV
jgi:hypothetical protein